MLVKVYTDGAARGNPDGPGGYGAVLEYVDGKGQLHTKELSQGYTKTTNNRMELMAVIAGLEALNLPCTVEVYSDSQYVVNAFNQHWVLFSFSESRQHVQMQASGAYKEEQWMHLRSLQLLMQYLSYQLFHLWMKN